MFTESNTDERMILEGAAKAGSWDYVPGPQVSCESSDEMVESWVRKFRCKYGFRPQILLEPWY